MTALTDEEEARVLEGEDWTAEVRTEEVEGFAVVTGTTGRVLVVCGCTGVVGLA